MIPDPPFQPGPLDAAAGWRPHRIEVPLHVGETRDRWVLRLAFTAGHGPCPDLEIEIDGEHRGLIHPEVRREDRAEVYRHGPIAGEVLAEVPIPGSMLPLGEHVLAITTTLDPEAATGPVTIPDGQPHRHREQFGHHFGSGITWRSITLSPATGPPPAPTLRVTPLYLHDGHELVELTAPLPARRAEVRLAGRTYVFDLPGRDFGQARVRFPVPEARGPAEVSVDGGEPVTFTLTPARRWTLHLIPHVHLDVGYTDSQGKVLELHSRNLDRALAALDRDPGFAFSVDGSLVLAQYLATRSEKSAGRVLQALRDGRIAVNAFHSLFLSGVASLEEIYRAAYLAARLRDEHGVPVTYANLTDVPSYSAAVPSVLAALGIDGFVGIENHHRGGNADSDLQHLLSPVMWEGVDGSRVLTHFSDTYSQLRFMVGDPQTVEGGAHALCRLLARYERPDYLPHDLAVIGTHADNEDLADGDAGFAARWNAVYAHPRIVVSTMTGYLDAVRPLADRLPVWRGDGGSYWEDGVGTGATVVAEHRRAQSALPATEGLAALVARAEPAYRPNRQALDAAWEGALFGAEHTWSWSHALAHPHGEQVGDQLDWKRHQVHTALRTAVDEGRRALSQLGELVTTQGPTLLVHNPLSWARDVEVEYESTAPPPLPAEVLSDCAGLRRYRMTVAAVPAFGYRTIPLPDPAELAPGEEDGRGASSGDHDEGWQEVPPRLVTDLWEAELDPATGAVLGLTHRPTGRRLLDGPLGQVLYVRNGPSTRIATGHSGEPHHHPPAPRTSLNGRRPHADPPELDVFPAAMRPVGLRRTYDGWRLRAVGSAPSLPHIEVDVLLRDADDRVDVLVRLEKEREPAKEAVYVTFPFAAERPRFHYDRQQGWIDPAADHAPGACQEWFTTQHGVVVASPAGAVAWTSADAPLFTAGDIVRGAWPERFAPPSGTVHSWVMNNYWPTNTPPEQDGTLTLRYAFRPLPAFDPVAAGRLGREVRAAPMVSEVSRLDKFDTGPRPLAAPAGSLLDLGLPGWVAATVAEPRDRTGLLVRLQDLSGHGGEVRLRHPGRIVRCRADETELGEPPELGGTVRLDPWHVITLKLR
ncbi:glycoside hydrolase family 38 N-terminal domain-containing protein [Nonomuraea sp. KM90]|uniref:glycoside hydrolase family 38 N-terminal domain-containing protein n=1 Tax=Nonomuraea sp. KM90 TaxID=3457428 RepID=UPI003FCD6BA3